MNLGFLQVPKVKNKRVLAFHETNRHLFLAKTSYQEQHQKVYSLIPHRNSIKTSIKMPDLDISRIFFERVDILRLSGYIDGIKNSKGDFENGSVRIPSYKYDRPTPR